MTTLILPGFSLKNKEWAEETQRILHQNSDDLVIYWSHWEEENANPNWLDNEVAKLIKTIKGQRVNILAKSIGTLVAMKLLAKSKDSLNKIILCGVPFHDLFDIDKENYAVLEKFPSKKLLCFQNVNDNHGSFEEVEQFLHAINSEIIINSKPRSDHEYPYFTDFIEFFPSVI